MRGLIICGFPGVGKTTASARSRDILDLESTPFRPPIDWGKVAEGVAPRLCERENPGWVKDYVDQMQKMTSDHGYPLVLVSTHKAVREELQKRELEYVMVVPDKDVCYDEYMGRYLKRGDPFDFIRNVSEHWMSWLRDMEAEPAMYHKCLTIRLKPGQVLSDILPIIN